MTYYALISGNTISNTALLYWFLSNVKRPFEVVYEANFDDQSQKKPGDFLLVAEFTRDELVLATGLHTLVPGENYIDNQIDFRTPKLFDKQHLIFMKERGQNSWGEICYRKDILPMPERPVKQKV